MGTINFKTGDFITLCRDPFDPYKYDEYEYTTNYEADLEIVKEILDKYYIYPDYDLEVKFEYGYYEDYEVMVNTLGWIYYDHCIERKWANKQVKDIEACLHDLIDHGMVVCKPGWCTTYMDTKESHKAVKAACKAMREHIRNTPTWYQYEHNIPLHRATTTNISTMATTKEGIA